MFKSSFKSNLPRSPVIDYYEVCSCLTLCIGEILYKSDLKVSVQYALYSYFVKTSLMQRYSLFHGPEMVIR